MIECMKYSSRTTPAARVAVVQQVWNGFGNVCMLLSHLLNQVRINDHYLDKKYFICTQTLISAIEHNLGRIFTAKQSLLSLTHTGVSILKVAHQYML